MVNLILQLAGRVEVEIGNLPDGTRFAVSQIGYDPRRPDRVVVTGWTLGTKLHGNQSRVRVRLDGAQTHVVLGEGEARREFESAGTSELNYPTGLTVIHLTDTEYQAHHQQVHEFRRTGGASQMEINEKQVKALAAKLKFTRKALDVATQAGDAGKMETAQGRVDAVVEEAKGKSITLDQLEAAIGNSGTDGITTITGKGATTKKPDLKAQNAERKATLVAKKAATPKPVKVPREKKLESTNSCLCGCGTETNGMFGPGHDARVKGILYKVERGELEVSAIPELVQPLVKFAGKRATAGKDGGDYRIVQSPVKFPGRPEIKLVDINGKSRE